MITITMNTCGRFFGILAFISLALFVASCDNASNLGASGLQTSASLGAAPRLQAGDRIRVTVYGEDKISGDYEIDPGGFVSLPLAGSLQAAGLTKSELEQTLSKKFRTEYLRNPKVTVDIANFRPFYVLGEVEKAGEYPYRSGLNVMSAMAVAGGHSVPRQPILCADPAGGGTRLHGISHVSRRSDLSGRLDARSGALFLIDRRTDDDRGAVEFEVVLRRQAWV